VPRLERQPEREKREQQVAGDFEREHEAVAVIFGGLFLDSAGGEALDRLDLVDRGDFANIEPGAAVGGALVEAQAALFEPLHWLRAGRAVQMEERLLALPARPVRLETAVAGAATLRRHCLDEHRVFVRGVGHATGERIPRGPKPVALRAA